MPSGILTTPLVSIVTPAFNAADHITACVQNVAAQQIPSLEHIVIDGASTDATPAILKELSKTHPHLGFISEPDRGQSDAMNKGHEMARGRLIGVLNVDDYYEPYAIQRALRYFLDNGAIELLVGACNVRNENLDLLYLNRPTRLSLDAFLLGFPHPVNPSAYFYTPTLFKRTGGFDLEEHYALDVDFLYRAVEQGQSRYLDEVWGNFVKGPKTKTTLDQSSNRAAQRLQRLQRRYLHTLSPPRRWRLTVSRPLVVLTRKIYRTLQHPRASLARYLPAFRR